MGKLLKWFYMLSKRLYKKPSFVVLLLIVPISVFLLSFTAKQNSGFVHVILAQTDANDEIAAEIINELSSQQSLIRFTVMSTVDEAKKEVESGTADEAWVFETGADQKIKNFPKQGHAVSIFTKEQTIPIRLAREKLTGSIYKYCAKAYYFDYIRTHFSKLDGMSDKQLDWYFENTSVDESLFIHKSPNVAATDNEANYLTSPIRGFLAILAVVCGLAATTYYKQDEIIGTFSYVKNSRKSFVAFGCVITAVINVLVVLFISLLISSLATNVLTEILICLLYAVCCTSFCLLLGNVFTSLRTYSAMIPLLIVLFICICPVFFDFRKFLPIQLLLPPTYYVNAMYDSKYLLYMVLYSLGCIILSFVLKKVKKLIKYR